MAKTDVVCLREVQDSLQQSVKRLIEMKIESLGVGHLFDIQLDKIKGSNGSLIIFRGMSKTTAESIKSLEGFDIAWFEEAQSMSQRSLDILRPTIRKPGSEIIFTWNPHLATDPVDVFFRGPDGPPPNTILVEVNYYDNPWFPDVLRKERDYDFNRDPEKYQHVWRGKYLQNSEARIFKNWIIQEFESPSDSIHRQGCDWGFSPDPNVLVRCHIEGRKLYIDYEAYEVECEIQNIPDLFRTIPESESWPIIADSGRPEIIRYMQKNGFPKIYPAVKGPNSVEDGVIFLQGFDIIVHPRCIHVIDELTLYRRKIDPLTGKVLPIIEDKKNHVIDSLRYACEGARRAQNVSKHLVVVPLPTRNRW